MPRGLDNPPKRQQGVQDKNWTNCVADELRIREEGLINGEPFHKHERGSDTRWWEGVQHQVAWKKGEGRAASTCWRKREEEEVNKILIAPRLTAVLLGRSEVVMVGTPLRLLKRCWLL